MRVFFTTLLLVCAASFTANAQDYPSYAQPVAGGDEQIRGRIASFDGGYSLVVRDERGFDDRIALHEGTIINPTGLELAPGMVVSVLGYNAGSFFAANEVDTPYNFYGAVPYYEGHPWSYYGPGISLGFYFGNAGWWHGREFHGPYYYTGYHTRVYPGARAGIIYQGYGGEFHGREFVAPRGVGGYHAFHGGEHGHGHGRGR